MTEPLVDCPSCLGERGFDQRYFNAMAKEHLCDDALAHVRGLDEDWMWCTDCDGTGSVTGRVAREMRARTVWWVDQTLAKLRDEGRIDWPAVTRA